jgi:hypothetical protein
VIEPEMKVRGVFQNDTFGDARLKFTVLAVEHIHDMLGLVFPADDANVKIGVLQIRSDIHVIYRDQHIGEGMVAREDGTQLALKKLTDSNETVFHGE